MMLPRKAPATPTAATRDNLPAASSSHGATKHEIPSAVARMLGFKATGAQLRSVIEAQINKLERQEFIGEINGMLQRVEKPDS